MLYKGILVPPFSRRMITVVSALAPICILLYLAFIANMKVKCLSCATVLLSTATVQAATPQALNTSNVAGIPNPGGPIFYYNGTGDVPPYNLTSPDPIPITPLNR